MVEEIQEYQEECHNYVEGMFPQYLPQQVYFVTLLEDGILDTTIPSISERIMTQCLNRQEMKKICKEICDMTVQITMS
jgi:hypothetical protein